MKKSRHKFEKIFQTENYFAVKRNIITDKTNHSGRTLHRQSLKIYSCAFETKQKKHNYHCY